MAGFPISVTALKKHNLRMLQILLVTLGNDEEAFDFGIDDPAKMNLSTFHLAVIVVIRSFLNILPQPQLKM